jgi:hypothetical protein
VKESTDGRLGVCKVLSSNPRTVREKSIDGEKAYQRVRKKRRGAILFRYFQKYGTNSLDNFGGTWICVFAITQSNP